MHAATLECQTMSLYLRTSEPGKGEQPAFVVDNASASLYDVDLIPATAVDSSAVLSYILTETYGCTKLPLTCAQVEAWRVCHVSRSQRNLSSDQLLKASLVAEFLQDKKLDVFTDACATQLILTRRTGYKAGQQIALSQELPSALLCDILQHLTRKSCLSAVLQQISRSLRPLAVAACVEQRVLRLPDTFATPSELCMFLDHLPHHPDLLTELYLNSTGVCGLRLPNIHRSISLLSTLLSTQSNLHTLDLSGVLFPRVNQPTPLDSVCLRLGPLRLPRSIRHLVLSRCELSHHPIATLQRICTSLRQLTYLDISHNALGVLGISSLAPSLRTLSTLATLNISSNGIRREGAVALAPHLTTLTALTALHVASNVLQSAGITALTEALPSLPLLATLDISGSVCSDAGAEPLSVMLPRMPALKHLDLAWSALCNSGVSNLRPGLTSAPVQPPSEPPGDAHTSPSNGEAPVPAGLTYLSLRNNNLTSGAAADLCMICVPLARTLQHLDLSCNRLRWGAGVLAGTIARLGVLRTLLLRDTCIKTSDFALLAPALAGLKHLSHVDVSSNQLASPLGVLLESTDRKVRESSGQQFARSPAGMALVPHSQSHPTGLLLGPFASPVRTSEGARILQKYKGAAQNQMAVNSSITHLNLSTGFDLDSTGAHEIVGLPQVPPMIHDLVREIVNRAVEDLVFDPAFGHSAQRAWRPPTVSFPNLRFLDLSGTSDAFPALSGLLTHCFGALETLNLSRVGLTASVARTLCTPLSACTRLTSLDISYNACMGAHGGVELVEGIRARMPGLHVLSLAMCGVGGAVIAEACIAGCSSTAVRRHWPNLQARTVSDPGAVHAGQEVNARSTSDAIASTVTGTMMQTAAAASYSKNATSELCTSASYDFAASAKDAEPQPPLKPVPPCMAPTAHADSVNTSRRTSAAELQSVVQTCRGTAATATALSAAESVSSNACNGVQWPQGSQLRQLLQLESLNLKGVALGTAGGLDILRELAVCAPKLRKLDVGGTQLAEGEGAAAVRGALDALTQLTMLGLSNTALSAAI